MGKLTRATRARKPFRRLISRNRRFTRNRRRPTLNRSIQPTPFPKLLRTKLQYSESIHVNPGALLHLYEWNVNSLFDPNRTATGHQPMYRDQLAVIYNRYRVRAIKWRMIITDVNTPVRYAVVIYNNTIPVDVDDMSEHRGAKSGVLAHMQAGANNQKVITGYSKLSDIIGETVEDEREQALMGQSPGNVVILGIRSASLDGATNMTSLAMQVRFTYYCDFFDIQPVVGS